MSSSKPWQCHLLTHKYIPDEDLQWSKHAEDFNVIFKTDMSTITYGSYVIAYLRYTVI